VRGIFDGPNYYQIPDYQRPYAWGEEEIEQLWDDIKSAFDSGDEYYFLGPMIMAQTEDGDLEVVDGQQRLTTLIILFCVLRDLHLKTSKDAVLKNQISNAVRSLVDKKYRLRLITQAQYHDQFEQEILAEVLLPDRLLTKKERENPKFKFMNAALILKSKLDDLFDETGMTEIKRLARYILGKVVMITITCSNRVSAIKLFQIINTRGLELSLADLVKSSLLSRIRAEKKHTQFMVSWHDIEKVAERNDESVTDLLTYYGYYLLASKPKISLYEEFEKRFPDRKSNRIVYDIKKFAEFYDEILGEKSKVIYSLRYLRDKVFWKTILITARMKGFRRFRELCKELRKLYFSYWIAGYTTAKTRNFSFRLVKLLKDGKTLGQIRKEIAKKLRTDKILKNVKEALADDVYGDSWLKPLLILIEYGQTDESAFIEYSRKLQIDHILPEEWQKKSYWTKRWKPEQADFWLHKMGNLTLLSGKKNIAASNEGFPKKKKIYKGKGYDGKTAFEISKRIIRNTHWTEGEARKRQRWMTRQTKRILDLELSNDETNRY